MALGRNGDSRFGSGHQASVALLALTVQGALLQQVVPEQQRCVLGKHVSAKNKLAMVLSAVSAIERGTLRYCDCVMSLGYAVLAEATAKNRALEAALGASRGSGSSNRTGSTLDVHMYMRSRKGANLATDVAARVLEARDAITLPEDRLADKAPRGWESGS
ncbi:hypothetical protein Q5P01_000923 [Channa striata]|uniref:Uncharacterized protein n=1 Tax=Channa striata TaxID=64152 RepID=A0AA88II35_CHASR|nr:hypothetical protein Q5P01_000923 [Channa striata]